MDYSWKEIDRLAEVLEAELAGQKIDPITARELALRLAELCPEIQASMVQVAKRMAGCVEARE